MCHVEVRSTARGIQAPPAVQTKCRSHLRRRVSVNGASQPHSPRRVYVRTVNDREHLRVAIDARPITTSRAGVATYCRDLVRGLGAEEGGTRFFLYAKGPKPPDLP